MARREVTITITDDGRDKGKVFRITEMPASDAEWWAFRAILAIGKAGVDLGDITPDMGMNGIAILGIKSFFKLDPPIAKPLMDEMWKCLKVPTESTLGDRSLVENDTEEVMTRFRLRAEILTLHTGFSLPGFASKQTSATPGAAGTAS